MEKETSYRTWVQVEELTEINWKHPHNYKKEVFIYFHSMKLARQVRFHNSRIGICNTVKRFGLHYF